MPSQGSTEDPSERTAVVREQKTGGVTEGRRRRPGDEQKRAREGATLARRYRARVEYDGTDFAGFQLQAGARTVQGELEAAVARLSGGARQPVAAAGRTDAGVHAADMVVAFGYRGPLDAARLERALNAQLPKDVAIREVRRVPAAFNPRFAARYREYRYTVWNGPRSPLRERQALGVRAPLDAIAMARAGSVFVGRHDFSAFGAADRNPVRTVHSVRVRRTGSLVTIDVRADAFLRGMVRRMVAALLEVGRGTLHEDGLAAALAGGEPALNGAAAPAKGLCLRRVALGRPGRHAASTDAADAGGEDEDGADERS